MTFVKMLKPREIPGLPKACEDLVDEVPTCPFLELPEGLSVRLQCVRLERDLYAMQPPLDGISNRDSFSLLL